MWCEPAVCQQKKTNSGTWFSYKALYKQIKEDTLSRKHIHLGRKYSGSSILRPPMGPRKCGLVLQVVLK